jgi:acetolactate synthase-1/2/3 large subunit
MHLYQLRRIFLKYSDQLSSWLVELGYTHCFYVGGGNIMHIIESLSRHLTCVPVIHEVAAGISAEYFNQTSNNSEKALALVTAGPGLTNIVTAISAAYLESRELLVIGGQVKTSDLSRGAVRQRGIQEIDGVSIVKSICKKAILMDQVYDQKSFYELVLTAREGRPGPVFIELPLDIQARDVDFKTGIIEPEVQKLPEATPTEINKVVDLINTSKRPFILIGGGIERELALKIEAALEKSNIPVGTTWNGADRISSSFKNYVGRPNTWGQRSSNIIIQQSDCVLVLGSRLGMQQTGFNWQGFIPNGKIIHVDIDESELTKGHPKTNMTLKVDANHLLKEVLESGIKGSDEWLDYALMVRASIPLIELGVNESNQNYVSPHALVEWLSNNTKAADVIIPCSSGGAFTTMMQVFEQKKGQKIVSNKGLASMGYGLSGAFGAAIANRDKRTVLVEGDGGFAQNLQELGSVVTNDCNLKIFIFDDAGHASIRMTQRNYFSGKYLGCDKDTGLGLPEWNKIFPAWGIPSIVVENDKDFEQMSDLFDSKGPTAFIIKINPEQTYFPKIASRITETGTMESNPIHVMTPDLDEEVNDKVFKYI